MARARLILVLSCICAACATRAPTVGPGAPDETPPLRLYVSEPVEIPAIVRSLTECPPLSERDAELLEEPGCHTLPRETAKRSGPAPAAVIEGWQTRVRAGDGRHAWLLEPVTGAAAFGAGAAERIAGLRVEDGLLVICVDRPTPDWRSRLRHPALWAATSSEPIEPWCTGASFHASEYGDTLVRRDARGPARRVRRVEVLGGPEGGERVVPAAGGYDLALAWGPAAATLLEAGGAHELARRLPGWDTVYALWLVADRRWTNDPVFRRWLRDLLDRERMARYLFGHEAEPALALSPVDAPDPAGAPGARPFAAGSSPRLTFVFDEEDPHAASLALRLKAVLRSRGVDLRPVAHSRGGLTRALEDREVHGAVVAHRPLVDEPLLALLETLWPLRRPFADEAGTLLRSTRIADPERRRRRARDIEADLVGDARLIPLVRLRAWLLHGPELTGIETGGRGVLRLDRATWAR
jgi:hypothetical protein